MIRITVGLCLLGLSGCSSVLSMQTFGPRVYSGVRYDGELLLEEADEGPHIIRYPWVIPYVLIDLPLSLALDTIFLPWTVTSTITRGDYSLQRHRRVPPPVSVSAVEGVVLESDASGFEVVPVGQDLLMKESGVKDATIKVFGRTDGDPETLCLGWSNHEGRFIVGGSRRFPWETVRVYCHGYELFELDGSQLPSPYDLDFWKKHRLLIRLVRR